MGKAKWASVIASAIGAVLAVHEWMYHHEHHRSPGPSLELAALGIGLVLVGATTAYLLHEFRQERFYVRRDRVVDRRWLAAIEEELTNLRIAVTTTDPTVGLLLQDLEESDDGND